MKQLILKENYSSHNLWEKLNILTEEQKQSIARGLDWTVKNAPSAVLVGGTAVIHYITGARDLTPDLDFMVHDVDSIITKISFDELNYVELNPGYAEPLGITVEQLNTDYLDAQVGNTSLNNLILQTPIMGNVGGREVRIINPELLVINKFESGRDKDVQDAFALLSSGKVDRTKYVNYLSQLKSTLRDYEGMISYKNFIP